MYRVLKINLETKRFYWFIERCFDLKLSVMDKFHIKHHLSKHDHTCFNDIWQDTYMFLWNMGYRTKKLEYTYTERKNVDKYWADLFLEKIKRDVKITCIYEGTSEIQQNIISTFRWKKTRKTKGAFYEGLAEEMDKLEAQCGDAGCRHIGLAARALNKTVFLVNDNRLTREQYVMFALADMMMYVEVAASLARRAAADSSQNDPQAEKTRLFSRLFANEIAELVSANILKILRGSGVFEPEQVSAFLAETSHAALADSYQNIIPDMDRAADIIFNR